MEIQFLDVYARFCEFVEGNLTLEKTIKILPQIRFNSDVDRMDPRRPYNHIWEKFVEGGKQCCLLIYRTIHENIVYPELLYWFRDTHAKDVSLLNNWNDTHQMNWGKIACLFFACFRNSYSLPLISEILGRSIDEQTEPGAANDERNVTLFWISLSKADKLSIMNHITISMYEHGYLSIPEPCE